MERTASILKKKLNIFKVFSSVYCEEETGQEERERDGRVEKLSEGREK